MATFGLSLLLRIADVSNQPFRIVQNHDGGNYANWLKNVLADTTVGASHLKQSMFS